MFEFNINLNTLAEIVEIYMPAFIGGVAQLFFLMLPIDLKNWRDDSLNVLTYIVLQVLVAAFIFIAIPQGFDLYELSTRTGLYILLVVAVLGLCRAVKIIPLEATSPGTVEVVKKPAVAFNDFFDNQRMYLLAEISQNDLDGAQRYRKIRERIALRKPEKVDQLGGG